MRTNWLNKTLLIVIPVVLSCGIALAQDSFPFPGEINADNVNIRADSTVTSESISKVNKGDSVEVVLELYDWYKIRLPKQAPSYIKKTLVIPLDEKSAKVAKERVNIRVYAAESSAIIGKANKDEIITILGEEGDWYKIEPVNKSFGWINKKFVNIVTAAKSPAITTAPAEPSPIEEIVTVEGLLKPKFFTSIATHKLISTDKNVFLLKGDREMLNKFLSQKVKVTGKSVICAGQDYSLIEVTNIEPLN